MVTVVYNPHLSHHNTFIPGGGQGNGKMIEGQKIGGKKKVRGVKRRKKLDE